MNKREKEKAMHEKNYRIISLLYLAILILPLAFYFAFSKLNQVESYSVTIRELGRSGGDILALPPAKDDTTRKIRIQKIDAKITRLSSWFESMDNPNFYVGETTPKKDFEQFRECWRQMKKNISSTKGLECWEKDKNLIFSMERMGTLELEKFKNILYLTLSAVTGLLILLVFAIRAFIRRQLRKHAITDEATGLYNRKYCLAAFDNLCAQAERGKRDFSILSFSIDGLEESNPKYEESAKRKLLAEIGKYLREITRKSDVASRYGDDLFVMLLPDTPETGAMILKGRIEEELRKRMEKDFPDFRMRTDIVSREEGTPCAELLKKISDRS